MSCSRHPSQTVRSAAAGLSDRVVASFVVAVGLVLVTSVLVSASPAGAAALRVAARPSSGCAHPTPNPSGQKLNFDADSDDGSYVAQFPSGAIPTRPLPVVFDLHAYEEPGQLQETLSGLGAYGETHRFVTVTPWIDNQQLPYWLSTVGSKDMAWFGALLTHVEATTCVDENRVFVTGYSNGAFMTSAIACQYSARIAAVAPVAGIQAETPCKRNRPVPVVAFHGTADPLVHYNGTPSEQAARLPAPDGSKQTAAQAEKLFGVTGGVFKKGRTIPEQAAVWAKRNGCSDTVTRRRIAREVTLLSWSCPHHADVELFRIQGGGHTWPGSTESSALDSTLGITTFEISADAEMWRFFESHPLSRTD